jgi:hypothetical protein
MFTALKAVATTSLTNNARAVTRYSSSNGNDTDWFYYYFELIEGLASGSEPDVVEPDDYNVSTNDKRYQLVAKKIKFKQESVNGWARPVTGVNFKKMNLRYLPNGDEPPEEIVLKKIGTLANNVTLEKTLHHFDLSPDSTKYSFNHVNNANRIYFNHFTLTDGTPTGNWYKTGGEKRRIQDHYAEWLIRLTKKARYRVSGDVHLDTAFALGKNVLRDPSDDNKIYFVIGGEYDFTNNIIRGADCVEIGADTVPSLTGFSSAFDSGGIK